jgi:DNA-binding IclR family transcriptional regulator
VRSLAVPVRDAFGAVVASVNASANASQVTLETLEQKFLPAVWRTAKLIEHALATPRV